MIVEYYRQHCIDVNAVEIARAWDAELRIRRTLSSEAKPHVEMVTCRKAGAEAAEQVATIVARRWIDHHADC